MDNLPKFLLADNSNYPNDLFVIHTEYPRFVLNVATDEVEWFEEFDPEDEKELQTEAQTLLEEAYNFYDSEILRSEE